MLNVVESDPNIPIFARKSAALAFMQTNGQPIKLGGNLPDDKRGIINPKNMGQ